MNLAEIRSWVVSDSGRYDLVNEDGSDNGANKYIQAGQQFLDQFGITSKRQAKAYVTLESGQTDVTLPAFRAVEHVFIIEERKRRQLRKISEIQLHKQFPDLSALGTGSPVYFSLSNIRPLESLEAESQSLPADIVRTSYGSDWDSIGITVVPPPERSVVLEVHGVFFSMPLLRNEDQNFWSVRFPALLVKAALYQMELFFRNTEGANDWLMAIRAELALIEMDVVEEESNGITQMWG